MTNIKLLLLKWLLVTVLGTGGLYAVYQNVWQRGYDAAHTQAIIREQQAALALSAKIDSIQQNLSKLSKGVNNRQTLLKSDIDKILAQVKSKPQIVIENNRCVPTKAFVDSINQAIEASNKK